MHHNTQKYYPDSPELILSFQTIITIFCFSDFSPSPFHFKEFVYVRK